jgi:hypothetical protein
MKVDVHQTAGATPQAIGQGAASQGVHRGDGDLRSKLDPLSQDRLELSGLVADIASAGAAGAARRAEHVKALAKLHRTGAYTPDPGALSHKLIQDALAGPETGNQGG